MTPQVGTVFPVLRSHIGIPGSAHQRSGRRMSPAVRLDSRELLKVFQFYLYYLCVVGNFSANCFIWSSASRLLDRWTPLLLPAAVSYQNSGVVRGLTHTIY